MALARPRQDHGEGPLQARLRGCDRVAALLGAPNTGKSSLFATLTGRSVEIANWPGVTVDIEIGRVRAGGRTVCIVDLPGTYGLVPSSPEEAVTRGFLLRYRPDLVVVILDMTQPEASLGLLVQAAEAFPGRLLVAATKAELAHALGVHVDTESLARELHVEVVVTSALEGVGVDRLREELARYPGGGSIKVDYGILEPLIEELERDPGLREAAERLGVSPRWLAVELLSGHEHAAREAAEAGHPELVERAGRLRELFRSQHGIDPEHLIIEKRVAYVERLAQRVVVRRRPASTVWQRIADLHMHPILGPIVSFTGLFITFFLVFSVNTGFPLNLVLEHMGHERAAELLEEYSISGVLTMLFDRLAALARDAFPGALGSLLADGIIEGVGFVVSFTPLIAMVYLSLAVLEDSGIATRMAVSFHPLFRRFGLSGRSVFPLIMGLGCNVPAVYSTRALTEEERLRAALATPFIPCQARLVVIVAFTSVLLRGVLAQSLAIIVIYGEAIAAALMTSLLVARLLQPRLLRGLGVEVEARPELIMEIPPVHRPHPRVVWWKVRDSTLHFLRKAGTVVFALAVILWALFAYGPSGPAHTVEESLAYRMGDKVGVMLEPLGIEGRARSVLGTSIVSGLVAKEGILTTIAVASGSQDVAQALESLGLGPAEALGFLVFTSLYFPCIATLAALLGVVKRRSIVLAYALYSIGLALLLGALTRLAAGAILG